MTTKDLPSHSLTFERGLTMTCVEMIVDGRKVAQTTLDGDVTEESESVKRFVHGYFHVPYRSPTGEN